MIKVFDFFSGCGGTSCGFQQAGLDVAFGLDFDHDAADTYRANFPHASFLEADIRDLSASSLASWLPKKRSSPILFSGCAPCQPFSKQNRQGSSGDPRRGLLFEFARFVEYWMPDYVFIENVPGMQRLRATNGPLATFTRQLKRLAYKFELAVIPALAYGVPQTRERLVLLASRDCDIRLPESTHGPGRLPPATVADWISGLNPLAAGEVDAGDPDHRAACLSALNLKRIRATPEGGGRQHWPAKLQLDCHKDHRGHTDVYGRLSWDKPAAGLTTRCISYSNGRFGHPSQNRALSVREAACLQTFPKSFVFSGSLASRARQIGNAVPPLMARQIGEEVLRTSAKTAVRIEGVHRQ